MQPFEYIQLSSWLGRSDALYLDARVLWLQISGMGGSFLLMWLSIEQMMKMIIMQERIKKKLHASKSSSDLEKELDGWGLEFKHNLSKLLKELATYYPNLFTPAEIDLLKKMHRLFEGKYSSSTPIGIHISSLNTMDCIFFKLRDLTSEDLPMSQMDMIDVDRNSTFSRLGSYTQFAYLDNPYFHQRANFRQ